MHVAHHAAADEHVFCRALPESSVPSPHYTTRDADARECVRGILTYQVRPPHLVHRLGVVQLDVQVLVHALQRAADLHFVLEFDCDFVLDQRFEETGMVLAMRYVGNERAMKLRCAGRGVLVVHVCMAEWPWGIAHLKKSIVAVAKVVRERLEGRSRCVSVKRCVATALRVLSAARKMMMDGQEHWPRGVAPEVSPVTCEPFTCPGATSNCLIFSHYTLQLFVMFSQI